MLHLPSLEWIMDVPFCDTKQQELVLLLKSQPLFILFISFFYLSFSIVATLGNLLVIRALRKASSIPCNLKKLFLSLAFSDLAVGLCVQPALGVIYALALTAAASENRNLNFLCPSLLTANMFLAYMLTGASFFTNAAIALDRSLAVILPLRYQALATEKRIDFAIVLSWLTSAFAGCMLIVIPGKTYLAASVFEVLGLLAFTVAYYRIFKVVRRHLKQIHSQHQLQNRQAITTDLLRGQKSALSAFYVYFLCLICYLPNLFASITLTIDNFRGSFVSAYYATVLFLFLNSSLNPLVYCWRYREIRNIAITTSKNLFRSCNHAR